MASSVNNIAATFSTLPKTPSSSSTSKTTTNLPHSLSLSVPKPISITSWNPHATIPKSRRSSLVNFYGPPGPPPPPPPTNAVHPNPISAVHSSRPAIIGKRVPNVTLSFLGRNDAVRTVGLASLCRGKRRVALVGVSAAFSPVSARFVEAVVAERPRKGWDLIACVAANDVFVMRAWGENLAVGGEKVVMLSDGGGELSEAVVGSLVGMGGVQPMRFCANVVNGVIIGVDFDDENGGLISYKSTVG